MQNNQKIHKNTKHGLRSHRLYSTWINMIQRCNSINNPGYKNYGAKGISVCERWLDIRNFIEDMYSTFKEGLTLDRINSNLGYSPDNCRWANKETQSRNTIAISKNNTSGYKGVSLKRKNNKYIAQISVKSVIYLGSFDTAIEAAQAYDKYIIDNNLEHSRNF